MTSQNIFNMNNAKNINSLSSPDSVAGIRSRRTKPLPNEMYVNYVVHFSLRQSVYYAWLSHDIMPDCLMTLRCQLRVIQYDTGPLAVLMPLTHGIGGYGTDPGGGGGGGGGAPNLSTSMDWTGPG